MDSTTKNKHIPQPSPMNAIATKADSKQSQLLLRPGLGNHQHSEAIKGQAQALMPRGHRLDSPPPPALTAMLAPQCKGPGWKIKKKGLNTALGLALHPREGGGRGRLLGIGWCLRMAQQALIMAAHQPNNTHTCSVTQAYIFL